MTWLYPRKDDEGKLIPEDVMVGYPEHLACRHGILSFGGIIPDSTSTCDQIIAWSSTLKQDNPIKLIINSPGGDMDTAFLLYDTIRTLPSPVETLGRLCCSAAVFLLGAGRRRFLLPHSRTMIHLPSTMFGGDARDMEIAHDEMQKYKRESARLLKECGAKKSEAEILADMDRQFWMSAQETIDYGLADEIMTKEKLGEWLK